MVEIHGPCEICDRTSPLPNGKLCPECAENPKLAMEKRRKSTAVSLLMLVIASLALVALVRGCEEIAKMMVK